MPRAETIALDGHAEEAVDYAREQVGSLGG